MAITGLPRRAHDRVYREFLAIWKGAPSLRFVKTWKDWDGEPTDDDQPAAAECPWVRITPHAVASTPVSIGPDLGQVMNNAPMRLTIETATTGLDASDSLNLGDALLHAIFRPDDATAREAIAVRLGAAGAQEWWVEMDPYATGGGAVQRAEGAILVDVNVAR